MFLQRKSQCKSPDRSMSRSMNYRMREQRKFIEARNHDRGREQQNKEVKH